MSDPSKVEAIFLSALQKATPAERAAYLDDACQGNAELHREVERLLDAQGKAGHFLEQPAVDPFLTRPPAPDQPHGPSRDRR